jgi:hypothetical protein
MNWNYWIRQTHRWLSIVFTVVVGVIFAIQAMGAEPAEWIYFLPLPPLLLMLVTGLYMFVLPYTSSRHVREK